MQRIGRYIFRQVFWWTVFITICLTCVVWLTQSLRFVEMIINQGLSAPVFIYFTLLLLPTFLSLILPIALFTAMMFTYNRLIMDSELVVLRAIGASQWALARPAVTLALLATLIGYLLTLFLIPASFREFKDLQRELRESYSAVLLQEGVFNTISKGVTVYIRNRTSAGELLGVIVHDRRDPKKPVTMMAERGAIVPGENGPQVVLVNGNRQEFRDDENRLSVLHFERYGFRVSDLNKAPEVPWREPRERYLNELFYPLAEADRIWQYWQLRMEGHHRLGAPLLNLAVAFVGLAFLLVGDYNRRGQMWRILAAVLCVVAMQASLLGFKHNAEKIPDLTPGIYLTSFLPILVGYLFIVSNPRRLRRRRSAGAPAEA